MDAKTVHQIQYVIEIKNDDNRSCMFLIKIVNGFGFGDEIFIKGLLV